VNLTEQKKQSTLFAGLTDEKVSDKVAGIPEAMPLIRKFSLLNSKEPSMYNMRRGQT